MDLATAQANHDAWVAADLALATGAQEHTIDTGITKRTVKKVDAAEITAKIDYWHGWIQSLGSGRNGIQAVGARKV